MSLRRPSLHRGELAMLLTLSAFAILIFVADVVILSGALQ